MNVLQVLSKELPVTQNAFNQYNEQRKALLEESEKNKDKQYDTINMDAFIKFIGEAEYKVLKETNKDDLHKKLLDFYMNPSYS